MTDFNESPRVKGTSKTDIAKIRPVVSTKKVVKKEDHSKNPEQPKQKNKTKKTNDDKDPHIDVYA